MNRIGDALVMIKPLPIDAQHCLLCGEKLTADNSREGRCACEDCRIRLARHAEDKPPARWPLKQRPEALLSGPQLSKALKDAGLPCTAKAAREYIAEHLPLESWYQSRIKAAIAKRLPNAVLYKQQQSIYQPAGLADLVMCIPPGGRYVGLEIKRPIIGEPTPLQLQRIRDVRQAGGIAYVISSVAEAELILDKMGGNG